MVLDVGNRDRVGKTPALKVHRVLFDKVLVTAGNQTSVYLNGTAWSPGQTELLDVRLQIRSLRFFEDCPPSLVFHSGDNRKIMLSCPVEERLETDTNRAPAFKEHFWPALLQSNQEI